MRLPTSARMVVIGNPGSKRTELLRSARERKFPELQIILVPWVDLGSRRTDLRDVVRGGDVVRIDSPGKDFEVEKMLLKAGALADRSSDEWPVDPARIDRLPEERGRIHWPAIWYRGLCRTLTRIGRQLEECPEHFLANDVREIQTMFDKTATNALLARAGIPVPPAIGRIRSLDHLIEEMQSRRWSQAFFKLAYGSSASGAVALRTSGSRMRAFTTVEIDGIDDDGQQKLYNTRKIRTLDSSRDIAAVIDAVSRHGAHAERWLPKAGIDGKTFDLRVVVIAGRACHTVARLSDSPMTNLHLLNHRGEADRVRNRCGNEAWAGVLSSCEAAGRVWPRSLHCGIDAMIFPDFRRHAILEVNAFGDLLPGISWRGMDTYEAELEESFGREPATAEYA